MGPIASLAVLLYIYIPPLFSPDRLPVTVPSRPDVRAAVSMAGGAGAGCSVPLTGLRGRGGVCRGFCP